jgi:hypothetical protein
MYPASQRPFQELMIDLIENLNLVQDFQHMLVMQDVLTVFLILVPLKSKTAEEIDKSVTYCVLMQFNVDKKKKNNFRQ